MVMGFNEEIPCCCTGAALRKQEKARSKSEPQFHSGKTPASIEADQILLAFHQLENRSNLAVSTTTSIEFSSCQNLPLQQWPLLRENLRSSNSLEISSKQVRTFRNS